MATSGTVSTTVFDTRKVIDHSFRRCKLTAQQITSEHLDIAKDLLFLHLSTLVSRGLKLWNIDYIILAIKENEVSVKTPVGVVDMLDLNLRTSTRHATGILTATEGVAANAFDGTLTTACTQTSAAGNIQIQLADVIAIPIYGILPNVSGTWDYIIESSDDGITYTPIITRTGVAVVAGEWIWQDVEGILSHNRYRLRATGTTVLDVRELVFQNLPQEIPFYQLNRTDYSNLPNKTRPGRPTQFWWDRQRTQAVITMWPAPQAEFAFAQLTAYVHTYIEDVGTLAQEIEVPQRWYLAVVTGLAAELAKEIKEVDISMIPITEAAADKELAKVWDGETDNSDAFFRPNISPYTR